MPVKKTARYAAIDAKSLASGLARVINAQKREKEPHENESERARSTFSNCLSLGKVVKAKTPGCGPVRP